jgi:hypothetical protein
MTYVLFLSSVFILFFIFIFYFAYFRFRFVFPFSLHSRVAPFFFGVVHDWTDANSVLWQSYDIVFFVGSFIGIFNIMLVVALAYDSPYLEKCDIDEDAADQNSPGMIHSNDFFLFIIFLLLLIFYYYYYYYCRFFILFDSFFPVVCSILLSYCVLFFPSSIQLLRAIMLIG